MIRVNKPSTPPAVLRTKGAKATRAYCVAFSRDPKAYEQGAKKFEFDAGLYGHPSVKGVLIKAQHGKCAFCESKLMHISYGDVEHLRPKAGWRQAKGDPLQQPGYYWLAYAWNNLFLACAICNQRFKENLFPLQTPSRRARDHTADLAAEDPLLIDPAAENPEALISFHEEVPYAVGGDPRGEATIVALGLRRPELAEMRRRWLDVLKALRKTAASNTPEASEAQALLKRFQMDEEEYSSMARALLR